MISLLPDDIGLLDALESEVSAEGMRGHWERLMEFSKEMPYAVAGSPGEEAAFQYIKGVLDGYGVPSRLLRFPAFIKTPMPSSLRIISPRAMDVQCAPHRAVVSSPPEGTEAEMIYVEEENLGRVECKGKVVLADEGGLGTRSILMLQEMGAAGIVAVSRDSFMPTIIHQSSDFSVSGNPTPDNFHLMPRMPMVKVSHADGQELKGFCAQGPVRVNMKSRVEAGWKTLPLLEAEIEGMKEPEKFVLVNGHVDTPFSPGVTDNMSGCVAMLELARIFNEHRDRLGRSIRICFWSGHETAAYAGSVWYNDEFWHELRYNCVAFLNIDSPGARGATEYSEKGVWPSPELWSLVKESISRATGKACESYRWPGRSGDRSFWGTGFPAVFLCATLPEGQLDPFVGFSGLGWWWHTPWATLDRGDEDALASNTRVYLDFILAICNAQVLPMNFVDLADKLLEILDDLQRRADKVRGYFNLYPVLERAHEFKSLSERLEGVRRDMMARCQGSPNDAGLAEALKALNHCIMWVSRHINLVACTDSEKTEQMSMEHFGRFPFPGLEGILELERMPLPYPGPSPDFMLLVTKLKRQRNKAVDGFVLANDEIRRALGLLSDMNG